MSFLLLLLLFRFAQFFIKPLMSADATNEMKAVDSGFLFFSDQTLLLASFFIYCLSSLSHADNQKNLSDACRMNQVVVIAFSKHFYNCKVLYISILKCYMGEIQDSR